MGTVNEDREPIAQQRELGETALTADTDLILTITEKVTDLTGRPIRNLPPMADAIDSENVTALIASDLCSDSAALTLGFDYCDCRITYNNQRLRITSL